MKATNLFSNIYNDPPYHYERTESGITIRKNDKEIFLYGDDETQFIIDCCFAKKYGESITTILKSYFKTV